MLFDDRDASPGEKLADADLIGCPWRVVVSRKTEDQVEVRRRGGAGEKLMDLEEFLKSF